MRQAWLVFLKELRDALRDRRTLRAVLLSAVLPGPLMLALISVQVSDLERHAETRELLAVGMAQAPSLANYVARQTWQVREAPPDYEAALRARRLGDPVLRVPADFEATLARGEQPQLELVYDSANQRATHGQRRVQELLAGFSREQAGLNLMLRGVSPALLQPLRVEEQDLADPAARGAVLMGMLPFVVLMAVVSGALGAAMDTTAGERERGSLEPLLMNPAPRGALVGGKWAAVALVGMAIAVLSCLSFLPGQWLLRSDNLAAMFRFGWREALGFIVLLVPLAGLLAALMMGIAIRSRSVKEAQASASLLVLVVTLLPVLAMINQEGEKPWQLAVPVLAQSTLMSRVLKGEPMGALEVLGPALLCAVLTLVTLLWVGRQLSRLLER